MLISKIQKDLLEFIEHDPDEVEGLIYFWYQSNSNALSAALTKDDGLKLIINVGSFQHFEKLSKKLFLVADTLVLRDTRKHTEEERICCNLPIPQDYEPKFWNEIKDELTKLQPSPFTIADRHPGGFWLADTKKLNNGYTVAYAGLTQPSLIPKEFTKWILGEGKSYIKSGSIVYAPFIPPIEWELELLNNKVSLPSYFNSTPCFHQNYEWLDEVNLNSLLGLQFPFIDNIDIETIAKVKEDNYEEFKNFSSSLLKSTSKVKSLVGTTDFIKEVKYIQKNEIDDNLSKIEQKLNRISQMSTLRRAGIVTGLIGLNVGMYLGAAAPALATGLSTSLIAMLADRVAQINEQGGLKENSAYFLWKLGQQIK